MSLKHKLRVSEGQYHCVSFAVDAQTYAQIQQVQQQSGYKSVASFAKAVILDRLPKRKTA